MRVFYHPQRGVFLASRAINPGCARYRGGADSDWRELAPVEVIAQPDGTNRPAPGQKLPRGFVWGDPARQRFGMGGPALIFGPLEKVCRDCRSPFVFTALEQKHWHEALGFVLDSTAVRCAPCRAARRRIESARRAYERALKEVAMAPSAERHLAVARAVLALIHAGGRAPIQGALASCTRARRLGAGAAAETLREALRQVRAAASERPLDGR